MASVLPRIYCSC